MQNFVNAYDAVVGEDLRATKVEIVIVTAMNNATHFSPPTHANVIGKLAGWNISDLKIAGFNKST